MDTVTIKRYTNLASLIAILKNKELTLLDPSKWEDKNDSHYLVRYGQMKGFKSLYALCFTKAAETSHHWKVFSSGSDGVCIKMNPDRFLEYLDSLKGVRHREVEYKLLDEIERDDFTVEDLPFLKRYPFRGEKEYRIIFEKKAESKHKTHAIPFDVSMIQEVTLSNSIPKELRAPVVDLLRSIEGCGDLTVYRSTLNENTRWKQACERAK
jgi:hypothetical protein